MPLSDGSVFRAAVENAPNGIVVCDERGTILFANRQMETISGRTSEEIVGHAIGELIPAAADLAALQGGIDLDVPHTLDVASSDGGRVPTDVTLSVAEGAGARRLVLSVVNLSTREKLRDDLAEASRRSEAFERLVTDLAARFVMIQPHDVDAAVVDSLEQISEMLGVDRGTWWRSPDDGAGDAVVTHGWTRPGYRVMQTGDAADAHVPWIFSRLQHGAIVAFGNPDELPNETDRETMKRYGTSSGVALPFSVEGRVRAFLGFSAIRESRGWPREVIDRLRLVTTVIGQALMRKESEEQLHLALDEVQRLRDQLASENMQLRGVTKAPRTQHVVVAESVAARRAVDLIEAVAPTPATVLLFGETGTGKEVFAQAIHRSSPRHGRPMITVNCGAIPATLIESELFGRERGAYTGALARQVGRFEMAHDSTIFLDEIGELPLEAQVKLLRVLQDKVIERLGGGQPIKVNVRIIAATNRNLERAVEEHTFREDLFYRLNVFPIEVPPLRERVEDVTALAWTFIDEYATAFRKPITSIAPESLEALKLYTWPGNVRELRNLIERAVIVAKGPRLVVDPPATTMAPVPVKKSMRLAELEAGQIRAILEQVGWRVRGKGGAAELLGIKPNTLDSRMARLGIRRNPRQAAAN